MRQETLAETLRALGGTSMMQNKLDTLNAEIESSEVVYAMDYEDDARLVRLERKVDALIKYLLENNL